MIVYAVVRAEDKGDALIEGKAVFESLVHSSDKGHPLFDYYVTFDVEGSPAAGKVRWGDLPEAARVASEDGQELVDRMKTALIGHQETPDKEPESVLDGEFPDGTPYFIYDQECDPVLTPAALDELLSADHTTKQVWIVPADVHF